MSKTLAAISILFLLLGLSFSAVPGSLADSPVTFAAIGDYGDNSPEQADVASLVESWSPEFILTMGDNSYDSTLIDDNIGQYFSQYIFPYTGIYTPAGAAPNRFFPSLGNHDYSDGAGINAYLDYFNLPGAGFSNSSGNERYYDFVWGPVHFFAVNSNSQEPDGRGKTSLQAQWLQTQLAASTMPWQIVFFHHAPYSSGTHGSNTVMQWPFASWGADAVIAGHNHHYERVAQDSIAYFTNGLGGRSRRPCGSLVNGSQVCFDKDYGAMRIVADSSSMIFEFFTRRGVLIDTYIIGDASPPPGGVVNVRIAGGGDDVEERASDGFVYTDSSDIELGDDLLFSGDQAVGLLFRNIDIPQGATINSAYLEFTVDEVGTVETNVAIHAQDADNADDFALAAGNVSARPTTTAATSWMIQTWGTIAQVKKTPDLSALVQEVVDRSGWVPGNNMVFIITGTGSRTSESYEGSPAQAARLHIKYTSASGPVVEFNVYIPVVLTKSGPVPGE